MVERPRSCRPQKAEQQGDIVTFTSSSSKMLKSTKQAELPQRRAIRWAWPSRPVPRAGAQASRLQPTERPGPAARVTAAALIKLESATIDDEIRAWLT